MAKEYTQFDVDYMYTMIGTRTQMENKKIPFAVNSSGNFTILAEKVW